MDNVGSPDTMFSSSYEGLYLWEQYGFNSAMPQTRIVDATLSYPILSFRKL